MDVFLIFKKEGEGKKLSYVIETTTDESLALEALQGHQLLNDRAMTSYWCEQWQLATNHTPSYKRYTHFCVNGKIETHS